MKPKTATVHVKAKWLIRHEAYQMVVTRMQVLSFGRMTFDRGNTKAPARKPTSVSLFPLQKHKNPSWYRARSRILKAGFVKYDATLLFFPMAQQPSGPEPPHYRGFTITLRHATLGRTPLDE
jgi:hypothetical protein